ncbi:hypothetical protein V5N11_007668 [Cardamine amara subsp. amara]|uniref:U1-type domain-containing protein n=1 Tax=Cardamine amara subsp. amara TaxID=228776 RepID=A0ABD1B928_CARAN
MKRRLMLASLPFSKKIREIAAARAKPSSSWWRDNHILHSVRQRQFSNGVWIKSLTTGGDKAEVEYSTAKTSVWWDIENCKVPKGYDGHAIAEDIRSVLLKRNYCGSLSIYAYGDTKQIASSVQQALSNTGVSLNHVPPGVKDGSDKKILVDMLLWAMENRAPANIMLISGDGDFSYVLHQLRMKKYNILLVRPENAYSPFLIAAAETVLLWTSIVTAGSGSEVPKQAEPRKLMNSNLVVENKSICQVSNITAGSGSEVSKQAEPRKLMNSSLVVEKNKSGPRFCQVCNVTCTSLVDFNSHLSSKKHKKKAALVASQSSHAKQKNTLYCSICHVHFPASGSEEHKSGRKHKNKLKAQAGHSR